MIIGMGKLKICRSTSFPLAVPLCRVGKVLVRFFFALEQEKPGPFSGMFQYVTLEGQLEGARQPRPQRASIPISQRSFCALGISFTKPHFLLVIFEK
jgi:hypothetical protein